MKNFLILPFLLFISISVNSQIILQCAPPDTTDITCGGKFLTGSLCNLPADCYITDSLGFNAWRFATLKSDPICGGSYRSELTVSQFSTAMQNGYWFYWETTYPSWQPLDPVVEGIGQYHQPTSAGSPAFEISAEGGYHYLLQTYVIGGIEHKTPLLPCIPGVTRKWLVHFVRSSGADGLIEVWESGVKLAALTGQNYYAGDGNGYFKFGIYKWRNAGTKPSAQGQRVVNVSNVKIGNAAATVNDFFPPTPPPINVPSVKCPCLIRNVN